MEPILLDVHDQPKLKDPVLIEGLPGVGNVGKLVVEHLIDELRATPWVTIHSQDLPPQVFVNDDGTIRLVDNTVHFVRAGAVPAKKSKQKATKKPKDGAAKLTKAAKKKDDEPTAAKQPASADDVGANGARSKTKEVKAHSSRDLILVTGDYQPLSAAGQYALVARILDLVQEQGCTELYALGGYGLGRMVTEPAVLGAATDTDAVARMKECGVEFREDEPGGGIIGASGLFLGLGKLRGMTGACLMGETSGYLVDPVSADAVLKVLEQAIGFTVDHDSLEEKAAEMDKIAKQLQDMEHRDNDLAADDLRYIG